MDMTRATTTGIDRAAAALEGHLAKWSMRTGIKVEVWALPQQRLPARIAGIVHGTILGVLREAERQAAVTTVAIALTAATGGLRLTVSDDGPDASAEAYEAGLRDRRTELAGLGGSLIVNSVRGAGTTVRAALPWKALT